MKKKPVCSECGSEEIDVYGTSRWNTKKQAYEHIAEIAVDATCSECRQGVDIKWVSAEPDLVLKAVAYEDIPVGGRYLYQDADGSCYTATKGNMRNPDVTRCWLLPEDKE